MRLALAKVPEAAKAQAYVANLGFTKTLMKHYRLGPEGIVDLANRFARAIGCVQIPALAATTVGKMGLQGVPGLVIEPKASVKAGGRRKHGAGDATEGGALVGGGVAVSLALGASGPVMEGEDYRVLGGEEPRRKRPRL